MDENVPIRINNPANSDGGRHAVSNGNSGRKSKTKISKRKLVNIVVSVLIVVVFLVGGWFLSQTSSSVHINGGKYQAVFLTNGQVYFGKLQKLSGSYFRLTDVFYLQTTDTTSDSVQNASDSSSTNVQLIKLGNEVHGPDDEMVIDKGQILFFENLKKDGKVTQSISNYYKK